MSLSTLRHLFVALAIFASASVGAAPLTVNVAGIQSYGEYSDAGNTVLLFNVGANAFITSVSYNVDLTAFPSSAVSEITFIASNSDVTAGFFLNPGAGNDASGAGNYIASYDLTQYGASFHVGADGILRLEFYEGFDDLAGAADGFWNAGTITFGVEEADAPIPEPASGMLMGAGLALVGYYARRRRRA